MFLLTKVNYHSAASLHTGGVHCFFFPSAADKFVMIKLQYRTALLLISTLLSAADFTEEEAHKTSTAVGNTGCTIKSAQMTLYEMRKFSFPHHFTQSKTKMGKYNDPIKHFLRFNITGDTMRGKQQPLAPWRHCGAISHINNQEHRFRFVFLTCL